MSKKHISTDDDMVIRTADIDAFRAVKWNRDKYDEPFLVVQVTDEWRRKYDRVDRILTIPITNFSRHSLKTPKAKAFLAEIITNGTFSDLKELNNQIINGDGYVDGIFVPFYAVVDDGKSKDEYKFDFTFMECKYARFIRGNEMLKIMKAQSMEPKNGHLKDRDDVKLNIFILYPLRLCVTIMNQTYII